MSEDDGMCENVVRLGEVRFTCDRPIGHADQHGGVYPGDAGGRPVDVGIQWTNTGDPAALMDEELAAMEERCRPRTYAGPPDEACRTGDCGGCERCWGPSVPVFGVTDTRRLIAALRASRAEVERLRRVERAARKVHNGPSHYPTHLGGCIGVLSLPSCECGIGDLSFAVRALDREDASA